MLFLGSYDESTTNNDVMTNNNGNKRQRQPHHHEPDNMPRCHVTSTVNQMTTGHVRVATSPALPTRRLTMSVPTYHITSASTTNWMQDGTMTGPGKEVMNQESQCRPIAGQQRHTRAQTTAFLSFGPSFSFFL